MKYATFWVNVLVFSVPYYTCEPLAASKPKDRLVPGAARGGLHSPSGPRTKEGSENGKARMCLRRSRNSPNRELAGFDGYVAS